MIAAARGCEDYFSIAIKSVLTVCACMDPMCTECTTLHLPSVSVPVLSSPMQFTYGSESNEHASFTMMPLAAAELIEFIVAIGAAITRAHGHDTTNRIKLNSN